MSEPAHARVRGGREPTVGHRRATRAGRPVAQAQDRDLHRDGRRGKASRSARRAPAWSVRRQKPAGGSPSPRRRRSRPCGRCSNTSSGRRPPPGFLVFAGDVVPRKKPAPDIYLLALEHLGLPASDAVVIEDSGNGLDAARAAGITCLVTVNDYTRDDDFDRRRPGGVESWVTPMGSGHRCWPTPAEFRWGTG